MRHLCALSILLLMVGGCDTDVQASPPQPDATTVGDLQARAVWRACQEVICAGAPIYAPDTTPQEAQDGLSELTDEVRYLSPADLDTLSSGEGRFADGGTLFRVEAPKPTERDDVIGVNVWITKGFQDSVARTYLFRWDGSRWTDTSADAVGVTVTSSVS